MSATDVQFFEILSLLPAQSTPSSAYAYLLFRGYLVSHSFRCISLRPEKAVNIKGYAAVTSGHESVHPTSARLGLGKTPMSDVKRSDNNLQS